MSSYVIQGVLQSCVLYKLVKVDFRKLKDSKVVSPVSVERGKLTPAKKGFVF